MKKILSVLVSTSFIAVLGYSYIHIVWAGQPYTVITLFNHTSDPLIRGLDKQQYNFNGYSTVLYQHVDLRGNAAQQQAQIRNTLSKYPDAIQQVVFGGHGETQGNGTDGIFTRQQYTEFANNAFKEYDLKGSVICDDCGSGRLPGQISNNLEGGALDSVSGSSESNQVGWAPYFGDRIQNRVLNGFKGDKNGDGVITNQEFSDAMAVNGRQADGEIKVLNPDAPMYFQNQATYENWLASREKIECIVPRPGQVDEQMTPKPEENVEFKGKADGYGKMTDEPGKYDLGGDDRDTTGDVHESETNAGSRKLKSPKLQEIIDYALSIKPDQGNSKKPVKRIVIVPNASQADEFNKASNGNPESANASYTIDGVKVNPGKYNVGKTYARDPQTGSLRPVADPNAKYEKGVKFDKDCKPVEGPYPTNPSDPSNPNGGNDNGNNGGGGGNNGGGGNGGGDNFGGGLGNILGPLLQSLLGGGGRQQAGQGYGQQNPYGNQYGNQAPYNQQQQQQNCANYPDAPVCGIDGQSYRNSCYLQQSRVQPRHAGVCAEQSASGTSGQASSSTVLNQLNTSGIPFAIVDAIRSTVTSIIGALFGGGTSVQETVIR